MADLAINIKSCSVTDKIDALLKCVHVKGTNTAKPGRWGEKYLAINEFNPDFLELLKANIPYKITGKVDGTCALIKNSKLNKRRDVKDGTNIPAGWFQTGASEKNGHLMGYLPIIFNLPDDKWFVECHPKLDATKIMTLSLNSMRNGLEYREVDISSLEGLSVEVMGPKIQSNQHNLKLHCVMEHGLVELNTFPDLNKYIDQDPNKYIDNVATILNDVKEWFKNDEQGKFFEGCVLHFANGKMFKLHRHHLDLEWEMKSNMSLDQIKL